MHMLFDMMTELNLVLYCKSGTTIRCEERKRMGVWGSVGCSMQFAVNGVGEDAK